MDTTPVHAYQSPQPVSMLPDRPIYRAANAYYHAYPYTEAITTALATPGDRMAKFDAGTDSLAYWLGFRAASSLANKGMQKLYESNPGLAEFTNKHPIISALPLIAIGAVAGELGGRLSRGGLRLAKTNLGVNNVAKKALYSRPGDWMAKLLKPVEKFYNRPGVRAGLAIGGLAFFGMLLFRALQDSFSFGRQYKQARKQTTAEVSPYDLKRQVLLERLQQQQQLKPVQGSAVMPMTREYTPFQYYA